MNRPIYISESDVEALIDMPGAIAALEGAFREIASGGAVNSPRVRARTVERGDPVEVVAVRPDQILPDPAIAGGARGGRLERRRPWGPW